jgi:hypothetical protein
MLLCTSKGHWVSGASSSYTQSSTRWIYSTSYFVDVKVKFHTCKTLRTNEWKCNSTHFRPRHWMEMSDSFTTQPLYAHRELCWFSLITRPGGTHTRSAGLRGDKLLASAGKSPDSVVVQPQRRHYTGIPRFTRLIRSEKSSRNSKTRKVN